MAPCWTRACSRSRRTSSARSASLGAPRASSSARTAGATSSPCCPRARARPRPPSLPRCLLYGGGAPARVPPGACPCGALHLGIFVFCVFMGVYAVVRSCCTQRSRAAGTSACHGRAPAAGCRLTRCPAWPACLAASRARADPPVCFSHLAAATPRLHTAPARRSCESPWSRPVFEASRLRPPPWPRP